jgi:two-component system chemotaxis response regulator CheY
MQRRDQKLLTRPLVLLVDGHDDTRELYAFALPCLGFNTVTVRDAAHALARASETRPNIIVTEVCLPRIDGWSLIDDFIQNPTTRDIPILLLTALSEPLVRQRARDTGCAGVLVKPCSPEALAQDLRALVHPSPWRERRSGAGETKSRDGAAAARNESRQARGVEQPPASERAETERILPPGPRARRQRRSARDDRFIED